MSQVWRVYADVLVAFVLALPAAAAIAWALVRWRRRSGTPAETALRLSLAEVGAVIGTAPWLWMTMRPDPAAESRTALIPLADLASLAPRAVVIQLVGNLLVLAALGFCLPVRFTVFASWWRVLAVAATASALIEVAQFVFDLGRVSSVDDVLVNTAGAVLAALLSRRWWRPVPPYSQAP